MADSFEALLVSKTDGGQSADFVEMTESDLMEGDVVVRVAHSTVNYKDGLAITGKAPVVRRWPMIPGVDFAGVVERSESPEWSPGDKVVLNGFGVGEVHYGGYAGRARLKGEWLVRLPDNFTSDQAMVVGTAGFTSALCVQALERQGLTPDSGPILVTGAAGGVGSVAIALLADKGYHVVASTGRTEEETYLKDLGATDVIDRNELAGPVKPLARETWAGAIDAVGSTTLANVLSRIRYHGSVAACGLAQGMDLPTSVAPFILRGVNLLGIDSVMSPRSDRIAAWDMLSVHLKREKMAAMTKTIDLHDVVGVAPEIVAGKVRGRLVVTVP